MSLDLTSLKTHGSEAGFTLTEALAAQLVISLAMGGIIEVSQVTMHSMSHIKAKEAVRLTQQAPLDALKLALNPTDPLRSDEIKGDEDRLQVREHTYRASDLGGRFEYYAQGVSYKAWPKDDQASLNEADVPHLEAIGLKASDQHRIGVIALRVEEPKDCQFDLISRQCRVGGS